MDLRTYVQVLRKSLVWIVLASLLGLGAGGLAYAVTPPLYASVTQFYVSTPLPEGANAQSAGQFAQARVSSYIRLLTSEELARRIIASAKLDLTPAEVASRINAEGDPNTVIVTATVSDNNAQRSLAIAKGLAATFGPMVDELDNQGRQSEVVVINTVSGPTLLPQPVSPSLRVNLLIGFAAGLVLSLIAVLLRELLDVTIRSVAVAQNVAQSPVLGTIPFEATARREPLLVGEGAMSVRGEAFRKLRTNLRFVDATRPAKVILVTSSVPQEGKSAVSANLALSLVETKERVLVVDADMRKPQLASSFDIEGTVGLSNVLAGQVEPEDAIQAWGDEGLSILPSGSIPPNPSELLGSERMKDLIAYLGEKYDHIIIDSPPVVPVTDAAVASAHVDAVLVVVRFGKTPRSVVTHALSALRAVRAPVVGVVLNMTRTVKGSDSYYGHNHYYRIDPATPQPNRAPGKWSRRFAARTPMLGRPNGAALHVPPQSPSETETDSSGDSGPDPADPRVETANRAEDQMPQDGLFDDSDIDAALSGELVEVIDEPEPEPDETVARTADDPDDDPVLVMSSGNARPWRKPRARVR